MIAPLDYWQMLELFWDEARLIDPISKSYLYDYINEEGYTLTFYFSRVNATAFLSLKHKDLEARIFEVPIAHLTQIEILPEEGLVLHIDDPSEFNRIKNYKLLLKPE